MADIPLRRFRPVYAPVRSEAVASVTGMGDGSSRDAQTAAKRQESPRETAERIIRDVDTRGDPCIYTLAEDYLRLEDKIQRATEAMPAVSATYAAYAILTGVFDA